MKATEILMEEHRVIEGVLTSLETAAKRLSKGEAVPAGIFLKAADFIKGFADGCHHKKEEGVLFPALIANGMPKDSGPVAVMLAEHEEGRRLTRAMRVGSERIQGGDNTAHSQVIENALGYVMLLRQHIMKEDNVLFPMADKVIPVEQHEKITEAFDHIEHEETGEGIHAKYLGIAEELEKAVTA
ncbi:MAG TPA: hemerythrin domain-containing protein [Syntrophales bacterium]|nr:hemerythrin domain-containing protein [Syntrophales bacterium]